MKVKLNKLILSMAAALATAPISAATVNLQQGTSGWNLMGVCSQVTAADFVTANSAVVEIQSVDGSYTPSGGVFNTLTTLSPGAGYWVKVNADTTVDVGSATGQVLIDLTQGTSGWNLMGVCSDVVASDFVTANSAVIEIQSVDGSYTPSGGVFNTLTTLADGAGYWVKVNADAQVNVGSTSTSSLNSDGWYQETLTTTSTSATKSTTVTLPEGTYTAYADLTVDSTSGMQPSMTITDASSNSITVESTNTQIKKAEFTVSEAGDYTINLSSSSGVNGQIWLGIVKSDATYDKSTSISVADGQLTDWILKSLEEHIWPVSITEAGDYTLTAAIAESGNGLENVQIQMGPELEKIGQVTTKTGEASVAFTVEEADLGQSGVTYYATVGSSSVLETIGSYTLELTKN